METWKETTACGQGRPPVSSIEASFANPVLYPFFCNRATTLRFPVANLGITWTYRIDRWFGAQIQGKPSSHPNQPT